MYSPYYIGFDVHKKIISFCIKTASGRIIEQGNISANRKALLEWACSIKTAWVGAMEATIFTGWIYDFLKPYALELKVAHPEMLKAITAAKKKNDAADAEKIADLLRCNLLPECHMASEEIRELRRVLRYRNLLVRESVKMKNKMSGLLMEVGAEYNKKRLHGRNYFFDLLANIQNVPDSVINLLEMSRSSLEIFNRMQKKLINTLKNDALIRKRVSILQTIPGVGEVTALTWVVEIGDPTRFSSVKKAFSYCGLCSAQRESAGKTQRGPISKKRNKHLQTILIEAAQLAPNWNPQLAEVYAREKERGHHNRATLAVARKLVAYMMAVDKQQKPYMPMQTRKKEAA